MRLVIANSALRASSPFMKVVYTSSIGVVRRMNVVDRAPFVQTMDSVIRRINHYPLDNSIGFPSVYPLDSDLLGG